MQPSAFVATALAAQRRGDLDAAVRDFARALTESPGDPQLLNALGNSLLEQGRAIEAREQFTKATAADPKAPELLLNLAKACRMQPDDCGERAALEAALRIDQRHFMARLRLAELHERRGEGTEAATHWGAVIAMAPPVEECPPALLPILARGRTFLAERVAAFEAAVMPALAAARRGASDPAERRFSACLETVFGRRQIYANECHGLHYPFLPPDEFFPYAHFPWFAQLQADVDHVRAEAAALLSMRDGLVPYVQQDDGTPVNKWSELDRSSRWSAFFLWRHGVRQEDACRACPRTAALVERLPLLDIPNRAPTVFFSFLEPRTRIPPHTGVTNTRAIVHLPLIVPHDCGFRVGGETRPWRAGEAFAFDDTIEHEAWNDSDEVRAVLILDTWNPYLGDGERDLLRRFFVASDESGFGSPAMDS